MPYTPHTLIIALRHVSLYIIHIAVYINSIQTWALEEAKKRMEARGDKVEYKPSGSQ